MSANLIVIDNVEGIKELWQYLAPFEYVTLDVETTGLTKQDEIIGYSVCAEESRAYYVILAKWNKHTNKLEYLNDNINMSRTVMQNLSRKSLIGHNFLFDAMMIESYFKVSLVDSLHTDTMILAHLLDENRRIGLKELGAQLFGEDSKKESEEMRSSVLSNNGSITKNSYEMYKADPMVLGKYGAKDALLTYKLFLHLVPELCEQKLDQFFYEDESMPLLKGPTYQLNTTGIQVDTKALLTLKKTLEAECMEAKAFVYQEIQVHVKHKYPGTDKKNTFNIGASQQLSWLLFGQLGLEFGTLTKGGKTACKSLGLKLPYTFSAKRQFITTCELHKGDKIKDPWKYIACDKKTLEKIAPKLKWVQKLLEYQTKIKLLNTYVEGIEERVKYGVLQPSYLQHGTTTGRYSSRNPNLQNLPRNDQRVKECLVARPGKVFVSADFSQLEPRTFAFYSKDDRLMSAFNGVSDFYSVVGMEVYDKKDCTPQKDGSPEAFGIKYKKLRDLSKIISLASAYGATPNQLAPTTGKNIEATEEDMRKYFERFPGVRSMMIEAHELVKANGFVTNLFGRVRRIPEAINLDKIYGKREHWELPYEARKLLNMACNFRIQSTGASIVNRAAIAFYNDCKTADINCQIVSQIHDELVVECSAQDAEIVSLFLQNAMESTTLLKGVSLEAIPRITKNLAK